MGKQPLTRFVFVLFCIFLASSPSEGHHGHEHVSLPKSTDADKIEDAVGDFSSSSVVDHGHVSLLKSTDADFGTKIEEAVDGFSTSSSAVPLSSDEGFGYDTPMFSFSLSPSGSSGVHEVEMEDNVGKSSSSGSSGVHDVKMEDNADKSSSSHSSFNFENDKNNFTAPKSSENHPKLDVKVEGEADDSASAASSSESNKVRDDTADKSSPSSVSDTRQELKIEDSTSSSPPSSMSDTNHEIKVEDGTLMSDTRYEIKVEDATNKSASSPTSSRRNPESFEEVKDDARKSASSPTSSRDNPESSELKDASPAPSSMKVHHPKMKGVVSKSVVSSSSDEYDEKVEDAVKKWEENFKRVRKVMQQAIKAAMPYFMDSATSGELTISKGCQRALFQWIADLRMMKPYALRLADASAKVVDGVLTGTLSAYGAYDQCVDTHHPTEDVHGQYCTIQAFPTLPPKPRFYAINKRLDAFKRFENDTGPMQEYTKYLQLFYLFPFRLGICVPSKCSREDIFNISSMVSKKYFPANVTVPRCEVRESTVIENYQIPFFCVVGILTLLVICGTATDVLLNRNEDDPKSVPKERGYSTKCILSFSIVSNWKMLMDTNAGSDDLVVLHGIRFFSMCWIIFGHTYFHLNFNVLKYLQITIELTSQFIFNSITNATLLVDNFFFLSGLLFIYIGMDIVKKTGKIPNPFYFALHRIWRFLPIQMFFVGFATLLPLMGDGPLWHENIDPIVDGCRNDWWANFLFINNLYRSSAQGCLSYSWYLAADMQVYLLCIPIVILIMKKPTLGLSVNFVVLVASVIGVAIQNYVRDLPPALLFTRADVDQRNSLMMETYYPPLHHLGPHNLGIFVGYYLRLGKSPKNMHWTLHVLAWLVAFTLTSAALFGVHPWNAGLGGTGTVATVLYASLSRMSWTIGLAWIVIACSTGCGGFLGTILTWKPFIPFSRLTFMVYMIHPLIQHVFYSTLREGIQARNALALFIFLGYSVASYFLAFFACFWLEAPFVNMGKIVFQIEEAIRTKKLTLKSLFTGKRPRDLPQQNGLKTVQPDIANGVPNGHFSSRYTHPQLIRNGTKGAEEPISNGSSFICRL